MLLPRGTRRRDPYTLSGRGAGEGGNMSKYFVQVGYTAEAWAAMSREPERVVERVQASAEALGGSIESLYFCFGDYDLMGVVDFPDSREVAAWSMAVSSGGDVRAFKTTTLLSIEEGLHALGQASQVTALRSCPTRQSDQPFLSAKGGLVLVATRKAGCGRYRRDERPAAGCGPVTRSPAHMTTAERKTSTLRFAS